MGEFDPYEAPRAELERVPPQEEGPGLCRDGALLVARRWIRFPDRCILCNAPASGYRHQQDLTWHQTLEQSRLFSLVAPIRVGLCRPHLGQRFKARAVAASLILLGICYPVIYVLIIDQISRQTGLKIPVAGPPLMGRMFFGLMLLGVAYGWLYGRVLFVRRIDHDRVWLKRISPDFLASLPGWQP